jgi:hypothetical protein
MNKFRLNKIEITEEAITEYDRETTVVKIQNNEIRDIQIVYGVSAERPVMAVSVLTAVFIASLYCGLTVVLRYLESPFFYKLVHLDLPTVITYLAPLWAIFSLYLIKSTLTKRFYFKVETASDQRKLQFSKATTNAEMFNFIESINGCPSLPTVNGLESLAK